MARGFNKAILMGNLARDPEVRYTTSKQAVAKLTVAVNRQWKNRDGEIQDQADFIPVVVWVPWLKIARGTFARAVRYWWEEGSRFALLVGSGERRWVTEVCGAGVTTFLRNPKESGEGFSPDAIRDQEAERGREKGFGDEFVMIFQMVDVKDRERTLTSNSRRRSSLERRRPCIFAAGKQHKRNKRRKPKSVFSARQEEHIDYKELNKLRNISVREAKIVPRRVGNCWPSIKALTDR